MEVCKHFILKEGYYSSCLSVQTNHAPSPVHDECFTCILYQRSHDIVDLRTKAEFGRVVRRGMQVFGANVAID